MVQMTDTCRLFNGVPESETNSFPCVFPFDFVKQNREIYPPTDAMKFIE